jgi:hypothetical protein
MYKFLGVVLIIVGVLAFLYLGIGLGIIGFVHIFTGVGSLFWNICLIAFRGLIAFIVGGLGVFAGIYMWAKGEK